MPEMVANPGAETLEIPEWSVGFFGPFRVTTHLDKDEHGFIDKEIDIDDRGARLWIQIDMLPTGELDLVARDVKVTLDFNFKNKRILFHGKEEGPLVIIGGEGDAPAEISPDKPLLTSVTVRTGLFSQIPDPPEGEEPPREASITGPFEEIDPADPGRKIVDVRIDYRLEPVTPVDGQRTNAKATMQFVVAPD